MCVQHWLMILLCLNLTACVTLSKEACLQGDWYGIGQHDGAAGVKGQARIEPYREACEQYKVAFDATQYLAGVEAGLPAYCDEKHGFSLGLEVSEYEGVCQNHQEAVFLKGYADGLSKARCQTSRDVRQQEREIADLRGNIFKAKDDKARKRVETEIDSLESELSSLRSKEDKAKHLYSLYSYYRDSTPDIDIGDTPTIGDAIIETVFELGLAVLSESLIDECD